jgi:hypothetical protein
MFAADGATAVRGTVESVDLIGETVVIKTPDGILYSVTVTEAVDLGARRAIDVFYTI